MEPDLGWLFAFFLGMGAGFDLVRSVAVFAVLIWSANLTLTVLVSVWFWLGPSIGGVRDDLCVGLVSSGAVQGGFLADSN